MFKLNFGSTSTIRAAVARGFNALGWSTHYRRLRATGEQALVSHLGDAKQTERIHCLDMGTKSRERRRRERAETTRSGETWSDAADCFSHSYLVLVVDSDLTIRKGIPSEADVQAMTSLDEHASSDFVERLKVLRDGQSNQ
jgi:hypothetical protein